ncbi:V-type ATP synthase subunit E [Frisingicoccus sp.]|uniref:V-type ATP synthase subunit E n=1 Tax=Frisingicoccus sp. TaxID=1918627 RepID=UPI002EA19CF6|nr:hypothetical protein [Frisingicoccus sp.]
MAGLEKITSQIIEDAKLIAAEKLEAAQKEADAIINEAKQTCANMEREASEKEKALQLVHEGRMKSSAEQQKKIALLRAKQELIGEVIGEAYDVLKAQRVEDYFLTMEKILRSYALPEDGEIYFSSDDLARMPKGFEEKIQAIAREKGGSLMLGKEPGNITDGFILVYGGIEENCTLKALLDAKKDQLQDKVSEILFA